jgi:4-oxalocrotonate tautomerase family enzyme
VQACSVFIKRIIMPIITVKVFEDELTETQTARLISDITEAVIPFVGEAVRANTWVLVEGIKSGSWGIGGRPFGLADLRQIQAAAAQDRLSGGSSTSMAAKT